MHWDSSLENDANHLLGEFAFFRRQVMEANRVAVELALTAAHTEHPLGPGYLGMSAEELQALASLSSEKLAAVMNSTIPLFRIKITVPFLRDITSDAPDIVGQANSEQVLHSLGGTRP